MITRRIVAVAEKMESGTETSIVHKRTAVFDETTTLKEVFDWLRGKSMEPVQKILVGEKWWDAKLSIHEDETTKEKGRMFDDHALAESSTNEIPF